MNPATDADLRRTLRGTVANYLAALFQLGMFLFHVIAARFFGPAAYGAYVFAWSAVEMGGKVAVMGMDKGMLRGVAVARARNDARFEALQVSTGIKVITLASAIVMGGLWAVAAHEETPAVRQALYLLSPVVFTWSLVLVLVSATMATGTMRFNLAVRGIGEPALMVFAVAGLGLLGLRGGGLGPALAHLSASVLTVGLAMWALHRCFGLLRMVRALCARDMDRALVRFTFPIMLAEVLNQSIYRLDILILGWWTRDSKQVAAYGAAVLLAGVISSVRYAFDPILSPLVAESVTSGNLGRLQTNLRRMTRWVCFLALPLFAVFASFGDFLLGLWGPEYVEAHRALMILSCAHLVNSVLGLHQWPVVMSGRSKLDLFNNLVGFVVIVALNLSLVPPFGLVGAAVATLAGNIAFRGLQVLEVGLLFRTHAMDGRLVRVLIAGGLLVALEVTLRWASLEPGWWTFAAAVLGGFGVYTGTIWRLGLAQEDRQVVGILFARVLRRDT